MMVISFKIPKNIIYKLKIKIKKLIKYLHAEFFIQKNSSHDNY